MKRVTEGLLREALEACHLALSFAMQDCSDPPPNGAYGGRCSECVGCLNAAAFIMASSVLDKAPDIQTERTN